MMTEEDDIPNNNREGTDDKIVGPNSQNDKYVAATELPVCCQADLKYPGMFRVKRAKGKVFSSGGFGVAVSTSEEDGTGEKTSSEQFSASNDQEEPPSCNQGTNAHTTDDQTPNSRTSEQKDSDHMVTSLEGDTNGGADEGSKTTRITHQYLFLEEVLFLHEQGLLECQTGDVNDDDDPEKENNFTSNTTNPPRIYSSPELYDMLKTFHLPMTSYLVYAHLRQQTFRVMRYTPNRIDLIQKIQACNRTTSATDTENAATATATEDDNKQKIKWHNLRMQLRQDVQQAPPPVTIHNPPWLQEQQQQQQQQSLSSSSSAATFAFCVYNPDCNFSKTNPGIPDFLVAITHYGQPALDYGTLMDLVSQANTIPIKLATVSDSGTVIMFGITDFGVPIIGGATN